MQRQKKALYGVVLIVMGIALNALAATVGGTDVQDFVSGLLLGISVGTMLGGVVVAGRGLLGR